MPDPGQPTRLIVEGGSVLALPRHIKLKHDAGRGRWIILGPERVYEPDETAIEVLKLVDGQRSVAAIAHVLAAQYQAPADVILEDITQMLQDLADKGVVR
ncbi:MAG: pyrroloquinoline quinone biosynthesis peptide chaperone PqqD [Hyphomicrobiaceae bacterium]|nr:pyrroloquinoline quinone biosynthesis peptide chaperone PqqD [Hyphomicrobiaceae bacterium]